MKRCQSVGPAVAFLLLLCVKANAGLPTPLPDAEAIKQLKAATKAELAFLKGTLKGKIEALQVELVDLVLQLAIGAIPPGEPVLRGIETSLNDFIASVNDCTNDVQRNVEAFASSVLSGVANPGGLKDFQVGGAGEIDKFVGSVQKELDKIRKLLTRGLKRFFKVLDEFSPTPMSIDIFISVLLAAPPPVPNPPTPPPAPAKKLRIDALLGGSDSTVLGDGALCAGGTAAPANGNVTVTITGPGGATATAPAVVDPVTCRWKACFTDLLEGSYKVEAQNTAGETAASAIGVPN